MLNFPLKLQFKIALAPQIFVTDAAEQSVFMVRQKLFKFKEAVTVFQDTAQTKPLYYINADRIIDFSARYRFTDLNGKELGSVKRVGMRSLWKAHYDIYLGNDDTPDFTVQEENPWVKVLDAIAGEIPILSMFTGYIFNPAYLVRNKEENTTIRLSKDPSFIGRRFSITALENLEDNAQTTIILSLMMITLLERTRG